MNYLEGPREYPDVPNEPGSHEARLNELYCALGRFLVKFSLIGARMVQILVPDAQADKATELTKISAPELFKQWRDTMKPHRHAIEVDREVLAALQDEAGRLSRARNRLVHSWWAVEDPIGPLMFSMKESPRGYHPTAEEYENYALQAAVVADSVTLQCGLLDTHADSRNAFRRQLAVTVKGTQRVVWKEFGPSSWYSSDGRTAEGAPA